MQAANKPILIMPDNVKCVCVRVYAYYICMQCMCVCVCESDCHSCGLVWATSTVNMSNQKSEYNPCFVCADQGEQHEQLVNGGVDMIEASVSGHRFTLVVFPTVHQHHELEQAVFQVCMTGSSAVESSQLSKIWIQKYIKFHRVIPQGLWNCIVSAYMCR